MSRARNESRTQFSFGTEDGPLVVTQFPVERTPVTAIDTNFTAGESPFVFDANDALGQNGAEFSVINDGNGDFSVSISNDGTIFGDEHVMERDETYSIDAISVDSVRLTLIGASSSYRIIVL